MKKLSFIFAFTIILCTAVFFSGCGKEAESETSEDTGFYPSTVSVSSFSAIAGENLDDTKTTDNGTAYIYEINDSAVGAAAYDLYKEYLDKNFTYSQIDSSVSDQGFTAVYTDTASGKQILYTESIDQDDIYTITVTIPE